MHRETKLNSVLFPIDYGFMNRFVVLMLGWSCLLVGLAPNPAWGATKEPKVRPPQQKNQQPAKNRPTSSLIQSDRSVFVPAPRDLIRPLVRAQRAIREKEISQAVTLIGEVLDASLEKDFLVPSERPKGVSISLRERALAMLGSLPAKDRSLYRLRYGVQAKQQLDQAIEQHDYDKISRVMQRFFFTEAGYAATMLMGHHHLDQGRTVAAATCFQRVVKTEEAVAIHDPEASVLLATCWFLGGSDNRATEALVDLQKRNPGGAIVFQGRTVQLFDRRSDAPSWLRKLMGNSPIGNVTAVQQWIMMGGNPARNGRSGSGIPLPTPRWSIASSNHPDVAQSIATRQRELLALDSATIPAVQPLAFGNTIVMRSFDRMYGVDVETGKRKWVYPANDFHRRSSREVDWLENRHVNPTPLTERLWQDAVYGQASSNGRSVFVVPKPGYSAQARTPVATDAEPTLSRLYNELVAINAERDGAFKWRVGGENGSDEPKLAGSFFLGPPLPIDETLYAVCQLESDIRIVALDSETGKLKWHQPIATTETSPIKLLKDRYRRLSGVTPSFADGILVCSTGNGALVGIELSTRSLKWGYQYADPERRSVQRKPSFQHSRFDPFSGLWRDSSILIANGRVLFTPVDAQELICVELHSGFPSWASPDGVRTTVPREDSMILACVNEGLAILVGETSLRAIDIDTGRQAWELPTLDLGKPSGRGYVGQKCYHYPTTQKKLVQIELATGKVSKVVDTNGVLGNLISYRGHVISHGVDRISSFPLDSIVRAELDKSSENSMTAPMLAAKAQILMQDGDYRTAVAKLEQAIEQAPSRPHRELLYAWIIQLIEQDFDLGMAIAKRHEAWLITNHRLDYLSARVDGMISNKKYEEATEDLFELLKILSDQNVAEMEFIDVATAKHDQKTNNEAQQTPIQPGSHLNRVTLRLDRWAGSQVARLHRRGGPKLKSQIDLQIREFVNFLAIQPSVVRLNRLQALPLTLLADDLRRQLASDLIHDGYPLRGLQVLATIVDSDDERSAAEALVTAADTLIDQKLFDQASGFIRKLESDYDDVILPNNRTVATVANELRSKLPKQNPLSSQSAVIENGTYVATPVQRNNLSVASPVASSIELIQGDSDEYSKYLFRFYGITGDLVVLDRQGNQLYRFLAREKPLPLNSAYNKNVTGRISIKNNLAILDISTELIAFDWLKMKRGENPVLWNLSTIGNLAPTIDSPTFVWKEIRTTPAPRISTNRIYVSAPGFSGICYLDETDLICVDALTGDELWRRTRLPAFSRLMGDHNHVIVLDAANRAAQIINSQDGRLIKTSLFNDSDDDVWDSYGNRILVSNLTKEELRKPSRSGKRPGQEKPKSKPEKIIGLYDLISEEFVWQRQFPVSTIACRVGREGIALLPPGNKIEFVDLPTGKTTFQTKLNLSAKDRKRVNGIGVAISGDNYLFHLKRGDSANRVSIPKRGLRIRPISYSDRLWVGSLICVDRQTGKHCWNSPVRFDNLQLCSGQQADLPVYFFVRKVTKEYDLGMSITLVQFIGIDLATGRLAVNHIQSKQLNLRPPYQLRFDASANRITLDSAGDQIRFQWTPQPDGPPRPVAHLTDQNSIPQIKAPTEESTVNLDRIEQLRQSSLQKALSAEKLLPQKRAEESRRLSSEN